MTEFRSGEIINDVVELLDYKAKGGQAEIWSVRDISYRDHTNLALKLSYTDWDRRSEHEFQERVKRLEQEMELLGGCNNRYIVAPHLKVGGRHEIDGKAYAITGVVMDLATEGSLAEMIKSPAYKTFKQAEKLKLMLHLAHGLHALQHYGIVHNDIKPQNLLVTNEAGHYIPRYADFGYAFRLGQPVVRGGTPGYMAPELHIGSAAEPAPESDVFSLGVTFWELIAERHPLEDVPSHGLAQQAMIGYFSTHDYIDGEPLAQAVDRTIVELVQDMCSRDRGARPLVGEIIERLETALQGQRSSDTVKPEDAYPQIARRFRWSPLVHELFQEHEQVYFCRGTRPEFDARSLDEQLSRANFRGYSIFRMLGSGDYMLRIWRREADTVALREVMQRYRLERGETESFLPTIHRPAAPARVRKRFHRGTEVLGFLRELIDTPEAAVAKLAKASGLAINETKSRRERGNKHKHAIRAVCRVRLRLPQTHALTEVICDKLLEALRELNDLGEIEVLAHPGREGQPAEFLVIAELGRFHNYADALRNLERTITGLVGVDAIEAFRSMFEMDRVSTYESYDGRLMHELHRFRARRGEEEQP